MDTAASTPKLSQLLFNRVVVVAALGYFVDIYDLVLFSIVRVASLKDLGLSGDALTEVGIRLLNFQMAGLLLGGILWGWLGDKRGRLSVLFGSIALYSTANLCNAFVTNEHAYAVLRFLAGIGLAGELGAAVTLVGESMPAKLRGYSTAFVAGTGILGAILAGVTAELFSWRISYGIGGVLGIMLLLVRARLKDSPIFLASKQTLHERGNLLLFFRNRERFKRYACTIFVGVPIWYVVGILVSLGPELARDMGATAEPIVGTGIMATYGGLAIGDFASGALSQRVQSRKKVIFWFLVATAALSALFLCARGMSPEFFYGMYFLLGLATGYWALFATVAAEQFGTNLRATAASTAPNFVRGMVIPMTLLLSLLRGPLGMTAAVAVVGVAVFSFALYGVRGLRESFGQDLDFYET